MQKEDIKIERAHYNDLKIILDIYAFARQFMAKNGNPNQWGSIYPKQETIEDDISKGNLFVIKNNNDIHAVFYFSIGPDPTYSQIEGSWLSDSTYGAIHRVASDGQIKGVFTYVKDFCRDKIKHLRIDTYKDNLIMQHLLIKNGFQKRGIIDHLSGLPRIAFEML